MNKRSVGTQVTTIGVENNAVISFRLPQSQLNEIRNEAASRHLDIADIMREMVREWEKWKAQKQTR